MPTDKVKKHIIRDPDESWILPNCKGGALALDVPNVGAIVKFEGHVRVLLTIKDNKESSQGFFFFLFSIEMHKL